jgi:hypothetical protein
MQSLFSIGARYRAAQVSFVIGVAFFLLPYPLYFWSLRTGSLVAEQEWAARGLNHGPWRWQWESAFVLIPSYVLLLGALLLAVSGLALAFKWGRLNRLWALGGVASFYVAFLYIQAHTVYWTIA